MSDKDHAAGVPDMPAGWYPDPDQVQTQRFWDGDAWTEQRAPLQATPASSTSSEINARVVLGALGAAIAIAGAFLPQLDSSTSLHIANNSFIGQGGEGILVIALALAGAGAAYRDRNSGKIALAGLLAGGILIAIAVYAGTGSRLDLVTTGALIGGQELQGSAGVGIWAVGIGGALIGLAGLRSDSSDAPST